MKKSVCCKIAHAEYRVTRRNVEYNIKNLLTPFFIEFFFVRFYFIFFYQHALCNDAFWSTRMNSMYTDTRNHISNLSAYIGIYISKLTSIFLYFFYSFIQRGLIRLKKVINFFSILFWLLEIFFFLIKLNFLSYWVTFLKVN